MFNTFQTLIIVTNLSILDVCKDSSYAYELSLYKTFVRSFYIFK